MARFKSDLAQWFRSNSDWSNSDWEVDRNLRRYFGGKACNLFTGRCFDPLAAMGDPNWFEASDIAANGLSVEVPFGGRGQTAYHGHRAVQQPAPCDSSGGRHVDGGSFAAHCGKRGRRSARCVANRSSGADEEIKWPWDKRQRGA
jgi:hypothetical protein